MNANDITFGIEIETTVPFDAIQVGPHGQGLPIPSLPGWKADADPSIRALGERRGCEFVSPVFRGADGLRQLIADIETIKRMGARVNASCGLHVHVGFNNADPVAAERLATLTSHLEKAIYATTGTKRRERGRWCAGINRYGNARSALDRSRMNRYHVVNFASHHPTVEFRAFSGTLNVGKIVGHIQMCVGLVERALTAKRTTTWTPRPPAARNSVRRKGEGQTELTRLFYQLGWIKGRQSHVHGNLTGEGIPSIQDSKRALMKMARKYDAQP